uniref:Uncharacterized protein n=1 Tax=Dictyoglomus turgidum TaxID=513050 RepID=A0A7C3WUU3_9BACT
MLDKERVVYEILEELRRRYNSPVLRKNLRLDVNFLREVLEIVENSGYDILPAKSYPTEGFSATAIDDFYQEIAQWVQTDRDYYIPAEQIIRNLIYKGWVIIPPRGL